MGLEDMVIVSVDDHIIEPPDVFDKHLPQKWRDKAPKLTEVDGGTCWLVEDQPMVNFALNAVAGRPKEELGFEPNSYDQIRPGCYDVHARIGDMNVNGLLSALCFGTFTGFGGETWARCKDKEAALVSLKAYNDWHFYEWCEQYPGRFIPLGQVPLWDAQLAAEEVRRLARLGFTAVTFVGLPTNLGLPSIHSDFWDPFLTACQDENVTLCLHIGGGGGSEHTSLDAPIDSFLTKVGLAAMTTASEWLWSHTLRRFPDIKVVLSEGGVGWVPYILERADLVAKNHGPWTHNTDFGGLKPSEYFRKRFFTCFIEDEFGLEVRDKVGIDTITFENDYPHADVTWPNSPEQLWEDFRQAACSDEEIEKITHQNAIRALNYDPIEKLGGRDHCTVGALRAQAADVDLTLLRNKGGVPAAPEGKTPTGADIAKQLPSFIKNTQKEAS